MFAIRPLQASDVAEIVATCEALGWKAKTAELYGRYLDEIRQQLRTVLVAWQDNAFAGYLTIRWQSEYRPFRDAGIPEIEDLNVAPRFRRQRVASRLMDAAEAQIGACSQLAGIGVGLDPDYGPAQRLYPRRGYVPDGRGIAWHGEPVKWGDMVTVDHDLVLRFTKALRAE